MVIPNELENSINLAKKACKKGGYLIETYFPGSLHSVSLFYKDRYRYAANFADELCLVYPFAVDTSFAILSSNIFTYGI